MSVGNEAAAIRLGTLTSLDEDLHLCCCVWCVVWCVGMCWLAMAVVGVVCGCWCIGEEEEEDVVGSGVLMK